MIERNAGLPPERRIEFRVGIHLGDVVEESDGGTPTAKCVLKGGAAVGNWQPRRHQSLRPCERHRMACPGAPGLARRRGSGCPFPEPRPLSPRAGFRFAFPGAGTHLKLYERTS